MPCIKQLYFLLIISLIVLETKGQGTPENVTVVAEKKYQKSKFHQWLWGKNWRKEWATPINVQAVLLDTLRGGLTPYEKSGGGESRSLRVRSTAGKEYVLRSINKYREKAVPKFLKNTWFSRIVQDGVSMSHPYGAFAVSGMLEEVDILHARPQLVYLPRQTTLGTFNDLFADKLYLFEERFSGSGKITAKGKDYKKFLSTGDVREKLRADNKYEPDQNAFIKARMFDILVSDVDRHEGNWKWGVPDTGALVFHPVPNDRDQVFFAHNGLLTKISLALIRRRFMQQFDYQIKKVRKLTLTKQDRKLDEYFTNEMDHQSWLAAAKSLQESLTDTVILRSIQQMPPEVFAISGTQIVEKLKRRRDDLQKYASQYYRTLAKRVAVNGSVEKEHFNVRKVENNHVFVAVYRLDEQGKREDLPYYERTFHPNETKRINLAGNGGNDVFEIEGKIKKLRIEVQKG